MTDSVSRIETPFGDKKYAFELKWDGLVEWEETFNKSMFGTFNEMVERQTGRASEVREIIRIGLIGGGTKPTDALRLVERYVEKRPLSESVPVALEIVEAALFGVPETPTEDPIAEAA